MPPVSAGQRARVPDSTRRLWFEAPGRVVVREESLPGPGAGEIQVRARYSAVSAGTELLLYRGQFPEGMPLDDTLEGFAEPFHYPTPYGYALVGAIEGVGDGVDPNRVGRRVFVYAPHQSRICLPGEAVHEIPDGIADLDAVFLAHAETAVNIVLDSRPLLQEKILVLGQGVIGLLVTALLARFPLAVLDVVEALPARRSRSVELGARPVDPSQESLQESLLEGVYDLAIEVSGAPDLLDLAIRSVRREGRVVVGSWYGRKEARLRLGEHFHRGRIQVVSSQVSTIAPSLRGGWDRARRHAAAWACIRAAHPSRWVTHTFGLTRAAEAYALLDRGEDEVLQVCISYP